MSQLSRVVLSLIGLVAGAGHAAAQVVSVEHVANVGDTVGRGVPIGSLTDLMVLDDDRILLSDLRNQRVLLFDEAGNFVRPLGGPLIGVLIVRGDESETELFTAGQKIVYSSDLQDPETQPVPYDVPGVAFTRLGTHYVRAGSRRADESAGLPIHVFSRDGHLFLRSFGADPPIRNFRNGALFSRRFSASSDSTFWSADVLRFRLQHWTDEGTLLQEFTREPEWSPRQSETGIDPVTGPRPRLSAISCDPAANVLWVATTVGREDWADAPTRADPLRADRTALDRRLHRLELRL
jgi:hypothetical protein